jgi:hypothetical protein
MTSQKKTEANRRNSLKSTGPRTEDGKARSSMNALKHGVLFVPPVLPGVEKRETWDAHVAGVLDSLAPQGYLEERLAERVALLLWRLGRVARYETETAATALENAEKDLLREKMFDLDSGVQDAAAARHELDRFRLKRLLPKPETLDSLSRYETTLERSLLRTLSELERLRASRSGVALPPPVAVEITNDKGAA